MVVDSRIAFLLFVAAIAAERGVELWLTQRNARRLVARGGRPVGDGHFPWMVILHAGLLIAAPLEVWLAHRLFHPVLGWTMVGLVLATMALRYWAILTLGDRWTTRVFVVPGEPPITGGPFRYVRHPNYLAVIVEVAAMPLVHTAFITALVASALNAWVLKTRIQVEEAALEDAGGYRDAFSRQRRFVPVPKEEPEEGQ